MSFTPYPNQQMLIVPERGHLTAIVVGWLVHSFRHDLETSQSPRWMLQSSGFVAHAEE